MGGYNFTQSLALLDGLVCDDVLDAQRLSQTAQELFYSGGKAFCVSFNSLIEEDEHIPKGVAEQIFNFWDEIPHGEIEHYGLVFNTCERCAVSAPQKSFDYTLKVLAEQPQIFSNMKFCEGYIYAPTEQRDFERCPICGDKGEPYYRSLALRQSTYAPEHLPVKLWMKCGGCGNLYTLKYPEEHLSLSGKKPKKVFPDKNERLIISDAATASGYYLSIWSDILNKLHTYSSGKTLLEVGIGEGELLSVALELGYTVEAVEIVQEQAQKISNVLGIPIWNGDFLDFNPKKTYSVITMGDVIEHVTDPERALKNAYRLLADDGALWLSTPNFESSFSRLRKFADPMWQEPWHITYFSYKGLEPLINKCGFEVREYAVSARYNGSMELILTKKLS